ncbi:MAG: response regulator [Candidatus Geothermincolia bacterium]
MPSKPKLLIIEDERAIINIMRINFEMAGWEVSGCEKSVEGLAESLIELPDVIILDLLMPGENGWEVLEELKANPVTRDIPVIICSVIKKPEEQERTLSMGAAAYVSKPFDVSKLVSLTEQLAGLRRELSGN